MEEDIVDQTNPQRLGTILIHMEEDGRVAEKLQEEGVKATTPQDLVVNPKTQREDVEVLRLEEGDGGFVP